MRKIIHERIGDGIGHGEKPRHRACPGGLTAFARLVRCSTQAAMRGVVQKPVNHRGRPGGGLALRAVTLCDSVPPL